MGARLTLGYDGPATGKWNDSAAVTSWIDVGVKRVQGVFADGLNLDVEILQSDKKQIASLTTAVKQMVDTMHQAVPGSHISVDVPSEGETGSIQATCGDMYGRDYNYKVCIIFPPLSPLPLSLFSPTPAQGANGVNSVNSGHR